MNKVEQIIEVLPPRLAKERDPDEIMEFLQERKRKVLIAIRVSIIGAIIAVILLLFLLPMILGTIILIIGFVISKSIAVYLLSKRATFTESDVNDYIMRYEKQN